MKLICRLFGHKYGLPEIVTWDRQFGKLTIECCVRCSNRRVEDDDDRRKRRFMLGAEQR